MKGTTRIVFLLRNIVIKIPNYLYCHQHFLEGCYANWSERRYTKMFKNLPDLYEKIAPTLFCSWFGLVSVQKRVKPLLRDLTEQESKYFQDQTTDIKKENFGWLGDRLVCIDYV